MKAKQSTFVSDVFKLLTGNAICRVLGWLVWPFVLTLYSLDDFGVWGAFVAIVGIPGAVSCLCYDLAILLPERDEDAANVLGLAALAAVGVAGLTLVAMLLAGGWLCSRLHVPVGYLYLAPGCVLVVGLSQALNSWAARGRRFGLMATARASADAVIRAGQVAAAMVGFRHAGGLIAATGLGYAATLLLLGVPVWLRHGPLLCRSIRPSAMLVELARYRKFPLVHSWGLLLNGVTSALPRFMLNTFFSATIAGYFEVAYRLVSRPANLLARAASQVFYQRASELHAHGGDLARLAHEVCRRMAAFSIVPMFVLAWSASEVCALGFERYRESARYLMLMYPMLVAVFVSYPMGQVFLVLQRQGLLLLLSVAILASRVAALTLGGYCGSPVLTVSLFSLVATAVWACQIVWALALAGVAPWRGMKACVRYVYWLAPVAGILVPAKLWCPLPAAGFLVLAGAVLAAYLWVVIVRDRLFAPFPA